MKLFLSSLKCAVGFGAIVSRLPTLVLAIMLASCEDKRPDNRQTQPPSVGQLVVQAYLFKEEKLTVKLNGTVYYERTRHAHNMEKFVDEVALPADTITSITVVTEQKAHTIIDTTFSISGYDAEGVLRVVITVPFPYDYKKYTDTMPYRKWGKLPIDSCIRFVRWENS